MSLGNPIGLRSSVPSIQARQLHPAERPTGNITTLERARVDAGSKYRVLLAHDLTGASEVAFVRAARLARERNGHLIILHVVESDLPVSVIEARRAQARTLLESQVRRWLGRSGPPYRIDIGIGDWGGAIAARARAHNADLVVTGHHRRRTFANIFASATIGRLLCQAGRPILVVANPDQTPYQRLLIPIALTSRSAARIQLAADFLPQARLHLLHARMARYEKYVTPISRALRAARSDVVGQSQETWPNFIGTLKLGTRKPIMTSQRGDPLVLVKSELARQKTDLLVWGIDLEAGMNLAGMELAIRSSSCDVLLHA
jgi:nucleotide-binding universal stress UspA family protein